MKRQKIQTSKYLAAFAMTTLIFVIGFIIGGMISDKKLSDIEELEQELTKDTISSELQFILLTEHPCESLQGDQLTKELFDIGTKLDFMESKLGKKNKDVIKLKEYYSLLEIRHWLLMKRANEECNASYDLILYFYSNQGDCDDCEQQGYVLSTIHKKYPAVNIYSFDFNIDDPAVGAMKSIYGITSAPNLVINGKTEEGFRDKEFIETELIQFEEKETPVVYVAE